MGEYLQFSDALVVAKSVSMLNMFLQTNKTVVVLTKLHNLRMCFDDKTSKIRCLFLFWIFELFGNIFHIHILTFYYYPVLTWTCFKKCIF